MESKFDRDVTSDDAGKKEKHPWKPLSLPLILEASFHSCPLPSCS
jgi:hypothetical protein